jgi:hypothetical protein
MREEVPISGPQWLLLDESLLEKVPNKNQYKHYKYIFNFHHKNKKSGIEVYRSNRYNDLCCPAKLKLIKLLHLVDLSTLTTAQCD